MKEGGDLSDKIDFSFYKKDLLELTKLHKANRFRKKIEDLLDDCNYHSLSSCLGRKDYDEAVRWIEQDVV